MNEKNIAPDALLSASTSQHKLNTPIGLACYILLLSYLTARFTKPLHMGLIESILIFCFLILCTIFARSQYPLQRKHYTLVLFASICCIPNALYDNYLLKTANAIFIIMLMGYFLQSASHSQISDKHPRYMIIDIVNALCIVPIRAYRDAMHSISSQIHIHHMKGVLIGLLLSIPLLFIILPLLTSADAAFQNLLFRLFTNVNVIIIEIFFIIIAIIIFNYLFPFLYGHLYCEKKAIRLCNDEELSKKIDHLAICPTSILLTIEVMIMIVYAIFLILSSYEIIRSLSLSYQQFSFSQFARRGFFELCIISCINASLIGGVQIFAKDKTSWSFQWIKRIFCMETILLILSAMLRMGIYIYLYGLTPLRVYSSWFMIVLLGCFIIALFHTNAKRERFIPHIIKHVCICFFVLNMVNMNALISSYNNTMPIEVQHVFDYRNP